MESIALCKVSYQYQNRRQKVLAVCGVNYVFEQGTFYAIIGRSGSGKSTILALIAGLDRPSEGMITYKGQNIAEIDGNAYRRDHVALIFQNYNLLPHLTVLENVMIPPLLQKTPKKEAQFIATEKIQTVGLDVTYLNRLPRTLSGGEAQRVAIARSLAAGAHVILADEPTGNLDEENARRIVLLMKSLAHEKNVLVIVATHDMGVAAEADVVMRLSDGRFMHNDESYRPLNEMPFLS